MDDSEHKDDMKVQAIHRLESLSSSDYSDLLESIKRKIQEARVKAALTVNRALVLLYWDIGHDIIQRQMDAGWGSKVIEQLSRDLMKAFPGQLGFSSRNLKYMRLFASSYPDREIVQQAVAQIPWSHNLVLIERVKDPDERLWYIHAITENGWSRPVLIHQIESNAYSRSGTAVTNFASTLPPLQSDLAQQLIKDPYNFDFLGIQKDVSERELEKALIERLRDFLLELGKGFALVGQQYKIEIGSSNYFIDLLFYHLALRCYVVIDLKVVPFEPEFAGKMNFYLTAVDEQLRHPDDCQSIGLILCKERNRIVVEYALRDLTKPMGVSTYRMLPDNLKKALPSSTEINKVIGSPPVELDVE